MKRQMIARTLGVGETTIRRDLAAPDGAPADSELTVVESTGSSDSRSDVATADVENTEQTDERPAPDGAPASYSTIVLKPTEPRSSPPKRRWCSGGIPRQRSSKAGQVESVTVQLRF